jgi:hypothetical protein
MYIPTAIGQGSRDGRSRALRLNGCSRELSRWHAGWHKTRTVDTQPAVGFKPLSSIATAACRRQAQTCSQSQANGRSPKFTRYRTSPENAGERCTACMSVNAGPLGAAKLPLTDTLMEAAPAARMSSARPITSPSTPFAYSSKVPSRPRATLSAEHRLLPTTPRHHQRPQNFPSPSACSRGSNSRVAKPDLRQSQQFQPLAAQGKSSRRTA